MTFKDDAEMMNDKLLAIKKCPICDGESRMTLGSQLQKEIYKNHSTLKRLARTYSCVMCGHLQVFVDNKRVFG